MIRFILVNGEVKFLTHRVEWTDKGEERERDFFDVEKLTAFTEFLESREIEFTVIEYEQPDEAVVQRCEGLKFETMEEAMKAYEHGFSLPPISQEQLRADIDYIAIMTGVEL